MGTRNLILRFLVRPLGAGTDGPGSGLVLGIQAYCLILSAGPDGQRNSLGFGLSYLNLICRSGWPREEVAT